MKSSMVLIWFVPGSGETSSYRNGSRKKVEDDSGYCKDAAKKAYIMHSSVKGGVFCPVWNEDYIEKVIPFIRQAYEKASG